MDLAATFFGKYLPPEHWPSLRTCIPDSLIAPSFQLTTEQQFFAGGHLMGLDLVEGSSDCSLELVWTTTAGSGVVSKP